MSYVAISPMVDAGYWLTTRDGDPRANALYKRHYSAYHYKDGREHRRFVGPGERIVLLTFNCHALFVWRKFLSMDHQEGVNCAIFRNESPILSSTLIREAEEIAWRRWPGERFYTYVNPLKVASRNPGYCFKVCGWRSFGRTQGGLIVLEKLP